jgi:hypothetical protein
VVVLPPGASTGTVESVYVHNAATTAGQSVQLVADVVVSGTVDMSLAWSVDSGSLGSIDAATGRYTAPGAAGRYKVWAASKADSTKKDYGYIDVTAVGGAPGGGGGTSTGATYYVAKNGSDSNDGRSVGAPFATFGKADSVVRPGQRVQVRGGTYTTNVTLKTSGTASQPITWEPYPGEHVIIDGSGIPPALSSTSPWSATPHTVRIGGAYLVIKGFEVRNSPNSSFMVWGTHHVTIDGVEAHDGYLVGIAFWESHDCIVQNSSVHDNYDYAHGGGNADGIHFNTAGGTPVGNHVIRNNELYNNSDDGLDTWQQTGNLVEYNVAHHNGAGDGGNGNGFKLGGNDRGGGNTVRLNVSYSNSMRGFVTNGCSVPNIVYNNIAWGHSHSGYTNSDGLPHVFRNNINSGTGGVVMTGSVHDHNSWNLGISSCGFVSTDPASPDFLRLASSSSCIDAGTPVGDVSYLGAAPDLGPFEVR